jgi:hypothetical protein
MQQLVNAAKMRLARIWQTWKTATQAERDAMR